MALEVEDGTAKSNANSYVSLADARVFATERNMALPTDDTEADAALIRAAEFVDQYGSFRGSKYTSTQSLQWPRSYVYVDNFAIGVDEIPSNLVAAQVYAAVDIGAGTNLSPTVTNAPVKRERVGVLETEYETSGGRGSTVPRATAVDAFLRPLLKRKLMVTRA